MSPVEFWKLSSSVSVAGAAAIVLLVTNFLAWVDEQMNGKSHPTLRLPLGFGVAMVVTGLAFFISPPAPGGQLGLYATGATFGAVPCLLFISAFGGSKLAAAARGAGRVAADQVVVFWRSW